MYANMAICHKCDLPVHGKIFTIGASFSDFGIVSGNDPPIFSEIPPC
jgi:hypothetical protein